MANVYVSNASPIIGFERLQRFDLLEAITGQLLIPSAVRREVFGTKSVPSWIVERSITQSLSAFTLSPRLGAGEREAIVLALEIDNCYLLLDDLAARRAAKSMSVDVIGTVGLLILAKQRGLLDVIRPYLDQLLSFDFRISERLYVQTLARLGESG